MTELNEYNVAKFIPSELYWEYLAMDLDGDLYAYVDEPVLSEDGNYICDGACKLIDNISKESQYNFFSKKGIFKISNIKPSHGKVRTIIGDC